MKLQAPRGTARVANTPSKSVAKVPQGSRARPIRPSHALPPVLLDALPSILDSVDPMVLAAGGLGAVALLGGAAVAANNNAGGEAAPQDSSAPAAASQPSGPKLPARKDAVLIFGASGRVGRKVVQRLLKSGRQVVAAGRSAETVEKVLTEEAGLKAGYQSDDKTGGVLFFESVDLRDTATIKKPSVWEGVSQVMVLVAGKAGPLPGGGFGYYEGLTPEEIEAKGVVSLMEALPQFLPKQSLQYHSVVPMGSAEEVAVWERMDDVIMGGNSASTIEAAPDVGPTVSRWKGDLIIEGGGFCGARTKSLPNFNLSAYDGIALRVKGDGSIFKLNIKTVDQLDQPESTYQTTFDTVEGQWHDVMLPWGSFVPVKRAQSDPEGAPLDPSKVAKFGLVLSRFEFNKMPNPIYKPGPFELLIDGGIRAYTAARPQIIHLSSAGVERNAIIGDDAEKRKKDVPIVQLNPGGVLNHKYAAELAVRATGYPYAVVRSTGMIDSNEGGPFKLEADQGDVISGALSRDDVADILTATVTRPEAVGKTIEVRRSEALDGRGKAMTEQDFTRMWLKQELDRHRWRVGLRPFPKYVPPPAPVSEERVAEIKNNIEEVRGVMKAQAEAAATKVTSPAAANGAAKTEVKEKELVSTRS